MARKPVISLRKEYDVLKEKVHHYEQNLSKMIQEKPLETAAIAFGAGIALGVLIAYLARRR